MGWLHSQRENFSFRHGSSPKNELILLKPFAEYLLALSILDRYDVRRDDVRSDARWAWQECDEGTTVLSMLQARPDLFELVTICGSFAKLGWRNPQLDHWLGVLFQANGRAGELPPWRRAALTFHLAQLGLSAPDVRLDPTSWIAARAEPWIVSEERLYAFTHHVFYLTDFGKHVERFDAPTLAYIELWLPVWAAQARDEGNWDLLAELLLVALCCQLFGGVSEHAETLLSLQANDGVFPGPRAGSATMAQFSKTDNRAFYAVYHTTLVATMMLAALRSAWHDVRASSSP